ncbi:MAG: hypothetical protein ACJAW3_000796 [Lentimonas sp.]|jgi:hypothetical protein
MKLRNILKTLIILLAFLPLPAYSEIKIINWNEKITLTKNGKESEIKIEARISDLKKGQYHTNFGFSFNKKQKISIKEIHLDYQPAQYSFKNNSLDIKLSKDKTNNTNLTIYISYSEEYEKIHQYLRKESIQIPAWAEGANARVEVRYPWSLTSATLNRNIKEFNKKFVFDGIVSKDGVLEIVKLTNIKNIWNVKIKNLIEVKGKVRNLEVAIPIHFANGFQHQYGYLINSNILSAVKKVDDTSVLEFNNLKNQNINIEIESKIYTGKNNNFTITRNPKDYLEISPGDRFLAAQMLQEISQDQSLNGLPIYARIGRYVHNYIKYDLALLGKLPSLEQIINGKIGVCTEYAKLFNVLSRAAKIPSLVVTGIAQGEYSGFEGHAWNLIYYQNKWISIDPTWDLMKGIVSSSHIYFHDDRPESIRVKWAAIRGMGDVKINNQKNSFEVEKLW